MLSGHHIVFVFLLAVFTANEAVWADPIAETEPNDTLSTANSTVGINNLAVLGEINPSGDQDYFTFLVTDIGKPEPLFPGSVRIIFATSPASYSFELTGPDLQVIFSGIFSEPRTFDFNPATIGGIGRYVIRVAGSSPASLGTYEFSISGVAGNPNSLPPTVMGTASTPIPIPANSTLSLFLFTIIIATVGILTLKHYSNQT